MKGAFCSNLSVEPRISLHVEIDPTCMFEAEKWILHSTVLKRIHYMLPRSANH